MIVPDANRAGISYRGSGLVLCLKLALFIIACGFHVAVGGANPFFEITALAAVLCVILAVSGREQPFGRSLTYWDEAVVFGLLSQLG